MSEQDDLLPRLPISWEWADFRGVASIDSELVSPEDFPCYPHVAPDNIEKATGQLLDYRTIAEDGVTSNKNHFFPGQIVYSKIRPYLSKVIVADFEGLCSADMYPISTELECQYLFRYMLSESFLSAVQNRAGNRVVLPKVNQKQLYTVSVPVAPFAEQRRIVAKIEALQERSRAAREALAEVKPLLEQFRQSVLAAAFRGDLTADWREQNPDVEPATELLERIRKERRQKWEQSELAKYETKGKKPPMNWQDKYKEPEPVDDSELPELPAGWCWTNMEELSHWAMYGPRFSNDVYDNHGARVLRTTDFSDDGTVDLSTPPQIPLNDETLEKYRVHKGDLLITRTGSLGTLAVFPGGSDAIAGAFLIHFRLATSAPLSWYVFHFLKSPIGQDRLVEKGVGSGRLNLNLPRIHSIPIPFAPPAEQTEILKQIDASRPQVNAIEELRADSESALTQLDQSILAKAFRGELVPQDPNDEPATVLLDRIREQREAQSATKKKGKKSSCGKKKAAASVNVKTIAKLSSVQFTKGILALLAEWEKPVSVRLLEPAIQLYHDVDLRDRVLKETGAAKVKPSKQKLSANTVHEKLPSVLGRLRGKQMVTPVGDDHYQVGDISKITITTAEKTQAREAIKTLNAYIEAKGIAEELVADRVAESAGGRLHVVEVV